MKYLTENNIVYIYQSAFFKNHSTGTSLSYLTGKILTGCDSDLSTGMILLALQKALDFRNHDILLQNMCAFRFSDHSVNWFNYYLSNRKFRVNTKDEYSCTANIGC